MDDTATEWECLARSALPDGAQLRLLRHAGEYAIYVDELELMASRFHGSEDALADHACDRLADCTGPRVLVGGLGMGFTLAAVLRRVGAEAEVVVAELSEAVVRWQEAWTGGVPGNPLRDPRVSVHLGDVVVLLEEGTHRWDAVILDVDNGPRHLSTPTNGWLYTQPGLRALKARLAPDGVLAIWSPAKDPRLTRDLRKTGFVVEVLRHGEDESALYDESGRHVLWMARPG